MYPDHEFRQKHAEIIKVEWLQVLNEDTYSLCRPISLLHDQDFFLNMFSSIHLSFRTSDSGGVQEYTHIPNDKKIIPFNYLKINVFARVSANI